MASTADVAPGHNSLPVCLGDENFNRLESLWWVMHQSDDPKRFTSVVTMYLDESATDDAAPVAVVGGLILNKDGFESFDEAFPKLLEKHGIPPPLHMKDFWRPQGRLANVTNNTRFDLFTELVPLINKCKLYSVAATLTTAKYKKHFEAKFRKRRNGPLWCLFYDLCGHQPSTRGTQQVR